MNLQEGMMEITNTDPNALVAGLNPNQTSFSWNTYSPANYTRYIPQIPPYNNAGSSDDQKPNSFLSAGLDDHSSTKLQRKNNVIVIQPLLKTQHEPTGQSKTRHVYPCLECGKVFDGPSRLKIHMLVHTGVKEHVCSYCSRAFSIKYNLQNHIRLHTGEKPYSCSTCGKCFTMSHHLRFHVMTHSGEKPHRCEFCEKSFVQMSNLKKHERLHFEDRPYRCTLCDKSFLYPSGLKSHETCYHAQEKRFKCQECGRAFGQLFHLKRHRTIHTGIKSLQCGKCNKRFRLLTSLQKHMMIHTGERPFVCELCKKGFSSLYNMKVHKVACKARIERMLKMPQFSTCFFCIRGFIRVHDMKSHLISHSGKGYYERTIPVSLGKLRKEHVLDNNIVSQNIDCTMCTEGFASAEELNTHLNSLHQL